jgi:hypothetical protein
LGVVKDDAEGVAMAGPYSTDAVTHVHPIASAGSAHRPVVDWENYPVTLTNRHDLSARLHAWSLLGQDKFAAGEIRSRFRQKNRHLQRKNMLAVKILMQAVVIVGAILEEERRRLGLPGTMAAIQESGVVVRITHLDA